MFSGGVVLGLVEQRIFNFYNFFEQRMEKRGYISTLRNNNSKKKGSDFIVSVVVVVQGGPSQSLLP